MTEERGDRVDAVLGYLASLDRDRDLTAKAVIVRLLRAGHYVEIELRRQLAPLGMDVWEMELLSTLLRMRRATMGQLQDVAQLTPGAITNRITRLEKRGFVIRTMDRMDRRQIIVELTPDGALRADEVIAANDVAERLVLESVDHELLARLAVDMKRFLLTVEGAGSDVGDAARG